MREPVEYDYDESPVREAMRTGARIVVMSLVVTAIVGGGYLMKYGRGGASAAVIAPRSSALAKAALAPAPTPTPAAAPSFADQVAAAIADLPQGSLTSAQKSAALSAYDTAVGLDFGPSGSPTSAASSACSILAGGTKPAALTTGVAQGANLSTAKARAFLLGATTLYCAGYASDFGS